MQEAEGTKADGNYYFVYFCLLQSEGVMELKMDIGDTVDNQRSCIYVLWIFHGVGVKAECTSSILIACIRQ